MSDRKTITVVVNGQTHSREVEPRRLLADFLREDLGLKGTHTSCEQGVCGVCTVLFDGQPALSCLMLAVQADGATIETVESLARGAQLHPIQESFWQHHGLQCGFCTPGFLMMIHSLLRDKPDATDDDIREQLDGVLCRCTGYQNIFKAAVAARDALARKR